MKLYHYYRSSAAFRVRIALNFKGIPWETALIDLRAPVSAQHTPEFRAVNPEGLILPRPAADRAQVRSLALAVACDIHPLGNTRVLSYLRTSFGADENAVNAWVGEWIGMGFRALEERVRRSSGDGRHMYGSDVTLADLCIVPQMYNARRYKVDVQAYPRLRAVCAHLESLPAFARAAPEAQPDAR